MPLGKLSEFGKQSITKINFNNKNCINAINAIKGITDIKTIMKI